MFFKTVKLFRFFGFDVKADSSWIFLSIFISWTLSTNVFPNLLPGLDTQTYQQMGVATLFGLIFSIIAHEVAHAVIAEYYKMPISSITLFIFGGVAEMRGEPSHAKGEFLMAIAGPIMSMLLGLFFYALADLYKDTIGAGPIHTSLYYLGRINMLIAVFNIVPVFPLDGGRALRAILWHKRNNLVSATRAASEGGTIFAYGLMAYGLARVVLYDDLISGVWIVLLGLFVQASCVYAQRQTENRSLLGEETVMRFAHNNIAHVTPDLTLAAFVDKYVYAHYQRSFPVLDRGKLVGIVRLQTVLGLERTKWQWLHVASVMESITGDNSIDPATSAADALDLMQRQRHESLVVAKDQKMMGVIEYRDLTAYLSVTMKVDYNKPVEKSR